MDGQERTDLLGVADELYALALGDFTPARDAKVKELKGTDLAPRVKACLLYTSDAADE